jgi:D-lactate dehydrogenase (cytochrome)
MSRVATTLRLGSRAIPSHARPIPLPLVHSIRNISSSRSSFATPTPTTRPTRPILPPASPPPPSPQQVPESIYRRQTTTAALYLLSLLGALGAGYALNLIIETPVPNVQYTLINSEKAKAYQLENQPTYGSLADYSSAIIDIQNYFKSLGKEDKVSTDESDLESHGISDWSYHEEKRPTVVVWVESTEEVQEIVRIATRWRVPITPFSGGTSLEGHFSSVSGRSCIRSGRTNGCVGAGRH